MTTCPECNRRAAYMAADPEMYRGDDTRCDAHRRAPALRWRSEPPDVPGWYWHRSKKNRSPRMRRYSLSARQWFAAHLSQDGHEWAGPIPAPEEGE